MESVGQSMSIVSKYMTAGNQREYELVYSTSGGANEFRWICSTNGSDFPFVQSSSAPTTGTWYFIACDHNASSNDIWISVNGGAPITQSHTAGVFNGTSGFSIGARTDLTTPFDGLIDEVGFWKRDIRSDLSVLYNSGSGLAYPFGGGARRLLLANAAYFASGNF